MKLVSLIQLCLKDKVMYNIMDARLRGMVEILEVVHGEEIFQQAAS